jgi:DsbC/DsbD-like thiol-disulfide interchange protein
MLNGMQTAWVGFLIAAATGGPLTAQSAPPASIVWTLTAPEARRAVAPGQRLEVTVRAVVERGWYVYAMTQPPGGPTSLRITIPEGQPLALAGSIRGPEPVRHWDAGFEIDTARHAGTVDFSVPVQVAKNAAAGKVSLKVQVRYQVCSDTLCLQPKTETLWLPLEIRTKATVRTPHE